MPTPEQRSLTGRLGIETRLATEDPRDMTAPARSAFQQTFIDQAWASIGPWQEALVAEHPGLSEPEVFRRVEAEVLRRAGHLRKAFYTRLGLASAKARAAKGKAGRHAH